MQTGFNSVNINYIQTNFNDKNSNQLHSKYGFYNERQKLDDNCNKLVTQSEQKTVKKLNGRFGYDGNGLGKITYVDGKINRVFIGKFKNYSLIDGCINIGVIDEKYFCEEKIIFSGKVENGKIDGQKMIIDKNGNISYGNFREGVLHGDGVKIEKNGVVLAGNFKEGNLHGGGVILFIDGKISKDLVGEFEDGIITKATITDKNNKILKKLDGKFIYKLNKLQGISILPNIII